MIGVKVGIVMVGGKVVGGLGFGFGVGLSRQVFKGVRFGVQGFNVEIE